MGIDHHFFTIFLTDFLSEKHLHALNLSEKTSSIMHGRFWPELNIQIYEN